VTAKLLAPELLSLRDAVLQASGELRAAGKSTLAGQLLLAFEETHRELEQLRGERDIWAAEAHDLVRRFVRTQ
jgi:hypothetical protein